MKSKEELFNMPIVELREYMNSLSNPEIQEVAKIFEEDDIERDPLELLTERDEKFLEVYHALYEDK